MSGVIDREDLDRALAMHLWTGQPERDMQRLGDTIVALLTPDPLLATLTRENEMLTKQVRELAGRIGRVGGYLTDVYNGAVGEFPGDEFDGAIRVAREALDALGKAPGKTT